MGGLNKMQPFFYFPLFQVVAFSMTYICNNYLIGTRGLLGRILALEIFVIGRCYVLVFLGVLQEPKEQKLTKKMLFSYESWTPC